MKAHRQARSAAAPSGLVGRAAGSLGFDAGNVSLVADGLAEQRDAAAVTMGTDIHVAGAAMDASGIVEPGLLLHELVHVAQDGRPAFGSSEDREEEAHSAADAALLGQPVALGTGTGGSGEPHHWGLGEWFDATFGYTTEAPEPVTTVDPATKTGTQTTTWDGDPTLQSDWGSTRSSTTVGDKTATTADGGETWSTPTGSSEEMGTTADWNPVDGNVGVSEDSKSTDWNEQGQTTQTDKSAIVVSPGTETIAYGESHETAQTANGQTTATSTSATSSVAIKNGVDFSQTTGSSTKSGPTGGPVQDGSSQSSTATGGLVVTPAGDVGVRGGYSDTSAETVDGTTTSRTTAVNGELTTNGGALTGTDSAKMETATGSVEGKRVAKGAFVVDLRPIPGSKQLEVVLSLTIGGELGLGGTAKSQAAPVAGDIGGAPTASASGGISVQASRTVSFAHTLSAEEAEAYVVAAEEADATGKTSRSETEFVLLADYRAAVMQAGTAADVAFSGGEADTAKSLGDGESFTVTDTYGGGINGTAGVQDAAGIEASAKETWTFSRTVKRAMVDGKSRMIVTVGRTDKVELGGAVSVSDGPLTAKVGATYASGAGTSATFTLDPDAEGFDALYDRILAAPDEAAIAALADSPELAAHASVSESRSESTGQSWGMTLLGIVGGALGFTGSEEEVVTTGPVEEDGSRPVSIDTTGTGVDEASLKVGGLTVAGEKETAKARSTVTPEGEQHAVFSETTDTTLADGEGQVKATELAGGVVKGLLEEEYQRLEVLDLGHADVEELYARAADHSGWSGAALVTGDGNMWSAWFELRLQILRPQPDPAWVTDAGQEQANKLARARSVSAFLSATGDTGLDMVFATCRDFERGDGGGEAADIGQHFVWTPGMGDAPTRHAALSGKVDAIEALLADCESEEDPILAAGALCGEILAGLQGVYDSVISATDVDDAEATAEMLDIFDNQMRVVEDALTDFQLRGGAADNLISTEDDLDFMLGDGRPVDPARIEGQLKKLSDFGKLEQGLIAEIDALGEGWFFAASTWDVIEASQAMDRLYERWAAEVAETRALYQQANVPREQWKVSAEKGLPRVLPYEPDANAYEDHVHALAGQEDYRCGVTRDVAWY